jgi:hypothetical protein
LSGQTYLLPDQHYAVVSRAEKAKADIVSRLGCGSRLLLPSEVNAYLCATSHRVLCREAGNHRRSPIQAGIRRQIAHSKKKKPAAVKVTQPKHVEEESLIRPMRTIRAIFSTDYLNIESAVISNLILN